jgi:hypothetical protein
MCLLVLAAAGCTDETTVALVIDLRTDLRPGDEFTKVVTYIEGRGARAEEYVPAATDDFIAGTRVAEVDGLPPALRAVEVRLLDVAGATVGERRAAIQHQTDLVVTMVIARDCNGVICPPAGDASLSECRGGECVSPQCLDDDPASCPEPECRVDADCAGASPCEVGSCAEGVCLDAVDDAQCGALATCVPGRGCEARAPCWTGPAPVFGDAVRLDVSGPGLDLDPWLTPDGLRLYFSSMRSGTWDVYVSTRPTREAPFGPAERADHPTDVDQDLHYEETADGRFAVISRRVVDGGDVMPADIFVSTRASTADAWSPWRMLDAVSTPGEEYDPHLAAGGLELWISVVPPLAPQRSQIWLSRRSSLVDDFPAPMPVPELEDADDDDVGITQTIDGRVVVFASNRDGEDDAYRLWYATRADRSAPFDTPVLFPVGVSGREWEPALSADGCELFFSGGTWPELDLFVSSVE